MASVVTLQGGERLAQVLRDMSTNLETGRAVNVGFLDRATYPTGLKVAQVAFWNEFGTVNQVPRPFFRRMIAKCSPQWGAQLAKLLVAYRLDSGRALSAMGLLIKDQLVQSIVEFRVPALKPSTIKKKGFDKPLIDTSVMQRAPDFQVIK